MVQNAQIKTQSTPELREQPLQYLVFPLDDDLYGLNIKSIREIIEFCDITDVPLVPDFIRGVLNLRGRVVPVIDLQCRFTGTLSLINKRSCIVILEVQTEHTDLEMGILVDAVNEVIDIPTDQIEPAPSFGTKIRTDFIEGMGKADSGFIILLQIDKVLSIDEMLLLQAANKEIDETVKLEQADNMKYEAADDNTDNTGE